MAIGGIAAEIRQSTGINYIAGLWDDHACICKHLLWTSLFDHDLLRRPAVAIAPTWTWASVQAKVIFLRERTPSKFLQPTAVASVVGITGDVSNNFGKATGGALVIRGHFLR